MHYRYSVHYVAMFEPLLPSLCSMAHLRVAYEFIQWLAL